jgi:hypothetical protein
MGKPRNIDSPEHLYGLFEQYTEDVKGRVRRIPKATNKGVVYEEHTPPLTMDGFKTFCNKSGADINRYWNNVDGAFSEYVTIVTRIKEEIRNDQIEGALIGQYNNNIVARLNGLTEKTDVTTGGDKLTQPITVKIVGNGDTSH